MESVVVLPIPLDLVKGTTFSSFIGSVDPNPVFDNFFSLTVQRKNVELLDVQGF